MRTAIWAMAILMMMPVRAWPDSCDTHSVSDNATHVQESSGPAVYDAQWVQENQEASFLEQLQQEIAQPYPENDPFEDPLQDPEWNPHHDMRGILYDEDGNELGRVGMESKKHREDREAREERERRQREERERRQREERERRERQERERREREERDRERREREERERQEREERERLERERQEEERQRQLREEEARRAQQQRPLTPEEQELAAANSPGFQEMRERQREDNALKGYQEASSNYGQSHPNAPGWSGSNHPAATVGEEMLEEVGGGVLPVGAVNAAGEISNMGPTIRARNKVIEELSD